MQFARSKRQSGVLFNMRLAIIVPYRNRSEHAAIFIPYMHTYLKMAGITDYQILLIEQADDKPFNRGKLLNVGYNSVQAEYYVFHDIDMLPITGDYDPCLGPTHLVSKATQFKNGIPYDSYFGGVTMFPDIDFMQVNGYSNEYWGWGCEDDDIIRRCKNANIEVNRREGGVYKSLEHKVNIDKQQAEDNFARYKQNIHYNVDGLSTLQFKIVGVEYLSAHAKIIQVIL